MLNMSKNFWIEKNSGQEWIKYVLKHYAQTKKRLKYFKDFYYYMHKSYW